MKFLANENIPIASVEQLLSQGFDITAIGTDSPSISDREVMEISIVENRTIITYDSDYGELVFKHGYKPDAGIVFIRVQPSEPLEAAQIVGQLVSNPSISFGRNLTVVDTNSIRQKKY